MNKYGFNKTKKELEEKINAYSYSNVSPFAVLYKKIEFFFVKLFNPDLPRLTGVELSNYCNLQCKNCPTPTTNAPKGFADDKTIKLAMKFAYPGSAFSFHRHGEPFLHKDFLKYLEKATRMGFKTVVSTNGILLNEENIEKLVKIRPYYMIVSLHTKKSVEALKNLVACAKRNDVTFPSLCAHKLDHNADEVDRWIEELELGDDVKRHIHVTKTHSWAGVIEDLKHEYEQDVVKRRVENCYFIKNNIVSLRWDGSVSACCFDSENSAIIGKIENLKNIKHSKCGYDLCKNFDSSWVNENM